MIRVRVAFITGELSGRDGWARLSLETAQHVARTGTMVRALVATVSDFMAEGVEVRAVLPPWPQTTLSWPLTVLRSLPGVSAALEGCDLVHCMMEPYLPLAVMASRWKRPLVVSAVGTYSVRTVYRYSPFGFWTRWADRIVPISRYTESRIVARAPTVVVNPGVDPVRFQPGAPTGAAADALGRVVLTAGEVKPRKGYHIAVRALASLEPGLRDTGLYIVGSTDSLSGYAQSLEALAKELGVGDRVHLLGRLDEDELISWYRRADVFLLNSTSIGDHFEGFGLVLLEANACGAPVVGCRDCGAEDIIVDGDNGLLVDQNDPAATARALSTILKDTELARAMSAKGLERAACSSWERSAERMVDVYRQLVQ